MWPFKSMETRRRTAIKCLEAMIDYREGALDAAAYLGAAAPTELLTEFAKEWFFLLKALAIVKEREK